MNIDVEKSKEKCTLFHALFIIFYVFSMCEAITILIGNVNSLGEME